MDTTANIDIAGIDVADRLTAAARAAALAPSIHNTQPWSWRIHDGVADLYADISRQLTVVDPDRRLLTVSCGSALHHARVALAADGLAIDVALCPTSDPLHLARITITGRTVVSDADARLFQMIQIRHTDRRPLLDKPINGSDVAALRKIASRYATGLHPLGRSDMLDLAATTARAQRDEIDDPAARHELDAWTGDLRPADAGIPDANILSQPAQTTVPSRDFGHVGTLAVNDERHDQAAMYAILYGLHDGPDSWIHAGEALSAMWLYATEHNIAVLPLSAAVEEAFTRRRLHQMLAGLGYANLAVRLGIADVNQPATPRTPRLPVDTTITVTG